MVKYRSGKILDAMANNKKSFLSSKKEDIAILIHMIGYFSRKAYFKDANKLIAGLENILKSPSYNHLYTEKLNFKFCLCVPILLLFIIFNYILCEV